MLLLAMEKATRRPLEAQLRLSSHLQPDEKSDKRHDARWLQGSLCPSIVLPMTEESKA